MKLLYTNSKIFARLIFIMEFKILKKSKKSRARLGLLKTPHGVVHTPAFVPVATQATIKALPTELVKKTGNQLLIANTFHLHLKPGENILKNSGGIHKFMNWDKPLMTDSGGFQVFSLGFGQDSGVGKILNSEGHPMSLRIKKGQQPKSIKITDKGVWFRSPINGDKIFLGPKESIKIQKKIGADIIFAFDECTSPLANKEYVKKSLERTHKWAEICIKTKKNKNQALFGIVQGSRFKDLRVESAKFINSLPFDGFGIGGDMGTNKKETQEILNWSFDNLDESKPRHLLGIGYLEDMEFIIKNGVDTFDCIVPTHHARRGLAYTNKGRINMRQTKFLKDKKPLDSKCDCFVCQGYNRNYICHLFKAGEINAMSLLTFHNLHFFSNYVAQIREKIKTGKI